MSKRCKPRWIIGVAAVLAVVGRFALALGAAPPSELPPRRSGPQGLATRGPLVPAPSRDAVLEKPLPASTGETGSRPDAVQQARLADQIEQLIDAAMEDGKISDNEKKLILSVARRSQSPVRLTGVQTEPSNVVRRPAAEAPKPVPMSQPARQQDERQGTLPPRSRVPSANSPQPWLATPLPAPNYAPAKIVTPSGSLCFGAPEEIMGDSGGLLDHTYVIGVFDSFRGQPDCEAPGNFGMRSGINTGIPLIESFGIGAQVGVSLGVYDLHGRTDKEAGNDNGGMAESFFFSTGLFHRALPGAEPSRLPISWGFAFDWLVTDNFGIHAAELFLGQWRGQVEWLHSETEGFGIWAAVKGFDDKQGVTHYESLDQVNLFWRHMFCSSGADLRVWVGGAEDPGEWTLGGDLWIPITRSVSVYGTVSYIKPSASAGDGRGWHDEYYGVSLGVAYFPGDPACQTPCSARWLPYLTLADSHSFPVEDNP